MNIEWLMGNDLLPVDLEYFFFTFLRRQSSSFFSLFRRMRVKKSWKVKEYRFVKGENNCEWKN